MTADIIQFPYGAWRPTSAEEMLLEIAKQSPANAFVIVWPKDGSMPSYHSSTRDVPIIMHRLQTFIHTYYNGGFE